MTFTDEERDELLKGLKPDEVVVYALNFINMLIERNEKERKELNRKSPYDFELADDLMIIHEVGLKEIKEILEYYYDKEKIEAIKKEFLKRH